MKRVPVVLLLLILGTSGYSQNERQPSPSGGSFYFTWGYNRDTYSKSSIRFMDRSTDDYDFTLHQAKAKDQPDFHDLFRTPISVPQYIINIGYFFNDKRNLGIELSWDHLKYVVKDNQLMHLTGDIRGVHYDQDTLVTPSFVHYENTNGNNYGMVSLVKRLTLLRSTNGNHRLSALVKGGIGLLIPKTDSRILGGHNDGPFRVSGFVVGSSVGLRYDLFRNFFLETGFKGAFADYTSAKVINAGRANHHFFSLEYIWAAGLNLPIGKK
jgi:hypothetical protein